MFQTTLPCCCRCSSIKVCSWHFSASPPFHTNFTCVPLALNSYCDAQGNRLEAAGTKALAPGLARNRSVVYLSLADNGIGSGEADEAALEDFRDAMMSCPTLTHIDLLYNRIGERGARVSASDVVTQVALSVRYNIFWVYWIFTNVGEHDAFYCFAGNGNISCHDVTPETKAFISKQSNTRSLNMPVPRVILGPAL